MSIEPHYELKFHIYDGNEKELNKYLNEYSELKQRYREEGSVMSRVVSYFFEGMIALVEGDNEFWQNNYETAQNTYIESNRMFNRFRNSRNVQARLDFLADRVIHRVEGLIAISKALRDTPDKIEQYTDALKNFNSEVNIANEMGETMSSYAAFSRASFAESQLLLHTSYEISKSDSGEAKRKLMKARDSIRQAAFIDPRFQPRVYQIEDALDDLTKNRILVKAEEFGDKATIASESGEYEIAKTRFRKASLFYRRASSLASDTSSRRFLLSSATIYEASELEAEGNMLFRRNNDTHEAYGKFEEAAKQVDKAIALMGRFGSDKLEATFKAQRDYYRAMGIQSRAINLFDNEEYDEAKQYFNQAYELFSIAIEEADNGENPVIVNMGEEAKADIQGYISMCDAMIE